VSSDELSNSSSASGTKYFDTVAKMMADVCDALQQAYDEGVIHRDIESSNLLLSPDGRVSINGFGLARILEQPGMTMSGEFVGSPPYMSPEQITAGRATCPRAPTPTSTTSSNYFGHAAI
jgi:serine/threonine protein kinase